ncbi:hypothetical protein sscle_04g035350 [Sclerotinia sclerotiorum 1980 UF-70]|uniref:Major facilitator superfamily (MFS) profile domain-containing protein n=2 Tax=Sclerotinia sclerotiorum (strain ATCC 18683 / 1980 / Ss-1) TaxID=665079 RepID=A0A1D9Q1F9_SCLS1|nr:hypothetical protein sscle_04g035350 [Sclerotinia sclerotiorum 1980 UF-70]
MKELSELLYHVHSAHRSLNSPESFEVEKICLTAHQDHGASNERHILNAKEEIEHKQNMGFHHKASKSSATRTQTTPGLKKSFQEKVTEEIDPNMNPLNWEVSMKFWNSFLVSAISFGTHLASSMLAPGVPAFMKEFYSTNIELAGFAASVEIYGRVPIYHVCNVIYICFIIAFALATNLNMLFGFRFLEGVWDSVVLTDSGGTITDIILQENRGPALSVGPIIGLVIGPVAGGFLAEANGWRWIF